MHSLEDRIYFDGAAASDVAAVSKDINSGSFASASHSDTSSSSTDSSSNSTTSSAASTTSNSTTSSAASTSTHSATSSAASTDLSSANASSSSSDSNSTAAETSAANTSSAAESSAATSPTVDVNALITAIVNESSASKAASAVNLLVVSSDVSNAAEIIADAHEHNITTVSYNPATETLVQLEQDIASSLNGAKAASINFVTADNGTAGVNLVSSTDIKSSNITIDTNISNFFAETSSLLADGGRITLSGDNSLRASDAQVLETALANASGHEVSFIDASTGDITTSYADAQDVNVYFIDSAVKDADVIIAGLPENATVVQLTSGGDGVQEITNYLSSHGNIDSVNIIAHGGDASLTLGADLLNSSTLSESYSAQVASWGNSLAHNAAIQIYSCNTANDAAGVSFVNEIASLSGHTVSASTDATGLDGDWTLEYSTAAVASAPSLSITGYDHDLVNPNSITSWTDLATALSDPDNYNVTIAANLIASGSDITIINNVTINGGSFTITAQGLATIFEINESSNEVTIKNLNFASAANCAIIVDSDAVLTVNGCTFSGNGSASSTGSAITADATTELTVKNCTFTNNTSSSSGGAIYVASGCNFTLEGTINASGNAPNLIVSLGGNDYSSLDINSAVITGGGVSGKDQISTYSGVQLSGTNSISNLKFTVESGTWYGGGAFEMGAGATFVLNSGVSCQSFNSITGTSSSAVFIDNTPTYSTDSPILLDGTFGSITINKTASHNDSLGGDLTVNTLTLSSGVLSVGSNTLTINDSISGSQNISAGASSSIITSVSLSLSSSITELDSLTFNNGSTLTLNANATIETLSINGTSSATNLFLNGHTLTITDSLTGNNAAYSFIYGGSSTTGTYGAGNLLVSSAGVTFSNFTIARTNATAIHVNSGGNLTMTGVSFSDNGSPGSDEDSTYGGAVYVKGGFATISNCDFSEAQACYGGALCVESGTLIIINSTAEYNYGEYGGVVYNGNGGNLTITSCTFYNNSADVDEMGFGGAVYVAGNAGTTTITSSTFTGNGSECGGGVIYIDGEAGNPGTTTITSCTFYNNNSNLASNSGVQGCGGAINNSADGIVLVNASTFTDNNTSALSIAHCASGGAIWNIGRNLTIKNSILANNSGSDLLCSDFAVTGSCNIIKTVSDSYGGSYNGTNDITYTSDLWAGGTATLANNGGPTQTIAISTTGCAYAQIPPANSYNGDPCLDQRGYYAVVTGNRDVGAYQSSATPPSSGDYMTTNTASGNWSSSSNWQTYNGSYWVAAGSDPNSAAPHVIVNNGANTLTYDSGAHSSNFQTLLVIGNLTLADNMTLTSGLTVDGTFTCTGYTLTLQNITSVNNSGTFNIDSLALTGTGSFAISNVFSSLDSMIINRTGAADSVSLSENLSVDSLTLTDGDLNIGSNTLTISGLTVGGGTLTGGTNSNLTVNGPLSLQSIGGGLGTLTIQNGTATLAADLTLAGSLSINTGAGFTSAAHTLTLSNLTSFVNNGTINGNLAFTGTSDMSLTGTGTYSLSSVLINCGGATVSMGANMNAGALTLTDGNLSIGSHTLSISSFSCASDSALIGGTTSNLVINGTLTLQSVTGGLASLTVNSGTTTLAADLTLNSSLTIASDTTLATTSLYTLTLNGISSLSNSGSFSGNLAVTDVSGLTLGGGTGVYSLTSLTLNSSSVILGSNISVGDLAINADSSLSIAAHTLSISGISGTGSLVGSNSSNLQVNATLSLPSVSGGLGSLTVNSGTTTLAADLTLNSGLSIASGATLATGSSCTLTLNAVSSLSNSGTLSGQLAVTGTESMAFDSGSYLLSSLTLNLTEAGNSLSLGGDLNAGALTLTAGTLVIGFNTLTVSSISGTGTVTGGANSNITVNGTLTLPSVSVGLGNLTVNSGTTTLGSNISITNLNLSGGNIVIGSNMLTVSSISGTGTVTGGANSNITIENSLTLPSISGGLGILTVNGGTTTLAADLTIASGLSIASSAGLDTLGYTLTLASSVSSFSNSGTLSANLYFTGAGALTLDGSGGTYSISSMTLDGGYSVTLGSDMNIGSLALTSGSLSLNGNTLALNSLSGTGTLNGGVDSNLLINGNISQLSVVGGLGILTVNSGTTTLAADLTLNTGLSIASDAAVSTSGNTLTLKNITSFTNNGTISGNLSLSGSGNLTIADSGTYSLDSFTIDRAGNTVSLGCSLNAGLLTLTDGSLSIGNNTLTISGLSVDSGTLKGSANSNIHAEGTFTLCSVADGLGALTIGASCELTLQNDLTLHTLSLGSSSALYLDGNTLALSANASITGNSYSTSTIYGGNSNASAGNGQIYINVAGVSISKLTITACHNSAVYLDSSGSLSATAVSFTDNVNDLSGGSAVYVKGSLSLTDCIFDANSSSAGNGGSIYIDNGGSAVITRSTFSAGSGASALNGAYIFADGLTTTTTITDSTFHHGSAGNNGGAIYINSGTLNITRSTFYDNTSDGNGGAVYMADGTSTITSSTFYHNTAAYGGAIYINSGVVAVNASTFANNTLSVLADNGGAIYLGAASLTLSNSILANSAGTDDLYTINPLVSGGYNIIQTVSGAYTAGTDLIYESNIWAGGGSAVLADNGGYTKTIAISNVGCAYMVIPTPYNGDPDYDQRGKAASTTENRDVGAFQITIRLVSGDYETKSSVTGLWSDASIWEVYNALSKQWESTDTAPDGTAGVTVTITNGSNITLDANAPETLSNLTLSGTLTLARNLTINTLNQDSGTLYLKSQTLTLDILTGAGTLTGNENSNLVLSAAVNNLSVTADSGASADLGTLTLGAGTTSLGSDISVNNIILNGGSLSIGAHTLTLETISVSSGTITGGSTSNITVGGTGTELTGITNGLGLLTVGGSGITTLGADLTLNTGLIINSGATLDSSGHTLTIFNAATVSNNGTLSGDLSISGINNLSLNGSGTYSLTSLSIDRDTYIISMGADIDAGSLSLSAGTLSIGSHTLTLSSMPVSSGILLGGVSSGLVVDGSAPFAIPAISGGLGSLTVSDTGITTLDTDLTLNTGLTVAADSVLNTSGNTLTLKNLSSISISGTLYGVLAVTGSGNLTMGGSGTYSLDSLNINRSISTVSLGADVNAGAITLTNGTLAIGSYTLGFTSLSGSGTLSSTSNSSIDFSGTSLSLPASITTLDTLTISNASADVDLGENLALTTLHITAGNLNIGSNTLSLSTLTGSGTITGSAASNLIINGTGAFTIPAISGGLGSLTVNRSGGITTLGADLTLNIGLSISSGSTLAGATKTLTINNASSFINDGTLSGTLVISGTGDLTLGGSGTYSLTALTVNRNSFTVSMGTDLDAGSLSLNNGTFAIGSHTLGLTSLALAGSGTLASTSYSSIDFSGTILSLPSSIAALDVLTVNNALANIALNSNLSLTALTLTAGNLSIGAHSLTLGSGGISGSGTLSGSASSNLILNSGITNLSVIDGLGALIVNDGTTTLGADLTINTRLAIESSAVLNASGHTLTLKNISSVNGSGTLIASDLSLSGSGNFLMPDSLTSLSHLTINRTGASDTVRLGAYGLTVTGALTLTAGNLSIGAHTLIFDTATISGTGHILGGNSSNLTWIGTESEEADIPSITHGLNTLTLTNSSSLSHYIACSNLILNGSGNFIMPDAVSILANLTVNRSGHTVFLGALGLTITDSLTLTAGNLSIGAHTLTLDTATVSGTGHILGGNSSNLTWIGTNAAAIIPNVIDGINILTLRNSTSLFTSTNYSSLLLDGTGNFTMPDALRSLTNLTLNRTGSGNTVSLGSNGLAVTDTLTLTAGNLSIGSHTLTLGTGGISGREILFGSAGSNLIVNSSIPSLKVIDGLGTLSINSGVLALGSNLTINTGLNIESNASLNASGYNLQLNNINSVSGSGTISADDLLLSGTGDFIMPNSISTLTNLTLYRSGALISLSGDLSISGTLNLSKGFLALGSYDLSFTRTAKSENASLNSMILINGSGDVLKSFGASGESFTFNIGTGTAGNFAYTPISVSFTSGTFNSGAYLDLRVDAAKNSNIPSGYSYINRYWTLLAGGISSFNASVSATYLSSDVSGTESLLQPSLYANSAWSYFGSVSSRTISGSISAFGTITAMGRAPSPSPSPNPAPPLPQDNGNTITDDSSNGYYSTLSELGNNPSYTLNGMNDNSLISECLNSMGNGERGASLLKGTLSSFISGASSSGTTSLLLNSGIGGEHGASGSGFEMPAGLQNGEHGTSSSNRLDSSVDWLYNGERSESYNSTPPQASLGWTEAVKHTAFLKNSNDAFSSLLPSNLDFSDNAGLSSRFDRHIIFKSKTDILLDEFAAG